MFCFRLRKRSFRPGAHAQGRESARRGRHGTSRILCRPGLDGQSIGNYQLAAEGQQTIATATISKAACVVAKAPVPSELTYTGAPQALAEAGDATDGVMQYSLDKAGSFSLAIPTGIDAGTYTLYYYVAGDQNHEDTDV